MRTSLFLKLVLPWAMTLFLVGAVVSGAAADAAETTETVGRLDGQKALQPAESDSFSYQYENRKDPFMPFIRENATATAADEIVDDGEPLTGMQLFEPGQLTLVGLLGKRGEYYAVVEDSTGKGYILTKGMKIGRRGVISDIGPNEVLIEETAITRDGKKIVTPLSLVLKKEGEK